MEPGREPLIVGLDQRCPCFRLQGEGTVVDTRK